MLFLYCCDTERLGVTCCSSCAEKQRTGAYRSCTLLGYKIVTLARMRASPVEAGFTGNLSILLLPTAAPGFLMPPLSLSFPIRAVLTALLSCLQNEQGFRGSPYHFCLLSNIGLDRMVCNKKAPSPACLLLRAVGVP